MAYSVNMVFEGLSNSVIDLVKARRFDEACAACRRLLEDFPDVVDGFERAGMLFAAMGDHTRASRLLPASARIRHRPEPQRSIRGDRGRATCVSCRRRSIVLGRCFGAATSASSRFARSCRRPRLARARSSTRPWRISSTIRTDAQCRPRSSWRAWFTARMSPASGGRDPRPLNPARSRAGRLRVEGAIDGCRTSRAVAALPRWREGPPDLGAVSVDRFAV